MQNSIFSYMTQVYTAEYSTMPISMYYQHLEDLWNTGYTTYIPHNHQLQQQQQQHEETLHNSLNLSDTYSFSSETDCSNSKPNQLYKTEICRSWEEVKFCRYGDKCQFAHGFSELKSLPKHPKYKTEICLTFVSTGICPYGKRCRFIHKDTEELSNMEIMNESISSKLIKASSNNCSPLFKPRKRLPVFVKLTLSDSSAVTEEDI